MSFNLEDWLKDRERHGKMADVVRRLCDRGTKQKALIDGVRAYYLAELLFRNDGNASAAAREYGTSASSVQHSLARFGIDRLEIAVAARRAKQDLQK